jgi:hypothetical protein
MIALVQPFPLSLTTAALYCSSIGLFDEFACSILIEGPTFISDAPSQHTTTVRTVRYTAVHVD